MSKNFNLNKARQAKFDEFYTQLSEIEKELRHYKSHFKNKVVLCNCDDPWVSNFFHYFSFSFKELGLKKLITTCYKNQQRDMFSQNDSQRAIYLEYTGIKSGKNVPSVEEIGVKQLEGDGDFRSAECIELLKQADIVVTNPPFSLFREYVAQLIEYNKKFLIIGNVNAITCKEIFKLLKANELWLGTGFQNGNAFFKIPANNAHNFANGVYDEKTGLVKFRNICWYTNLDHSKRHENITLFRYYTSNEYPHYDNYDAINVDKVADIPIDWSGVMGVPVTFLDKYNPEQFEIVGESSYHDGQEYTKPINFINGKMIYHRILIRNKKGRR